MPVLAAAFTALALVLYQQFVLHLPHKMAVLFFTTYLLFLLAFFHFFPGELDYGAIALIAAFIVILEGTLIFVTRKLESKHERKS